jgi:hypothetical protein
MLTQVLKQADMLVGVCCKKHEHFSHSLLPTLCKLCPFKAGSYKNDQVWGPGQLTGTRYLGHCSTEITGSNQATYMSALNSVINACPDHEPMEAEREKRE